jgi:hypothetical protein
VGVEGQIINDINKRAFINRSEEHFIEKICEEKKED